MSDDKDKKFRARLDEVRNRIAIRYAQIGILLEAQDAAITTLLSFLPKEEDPAPSDGEPTPQSN